MKIKAGLALERGRHKVFNKVYAFYWHWQSPTIYTAQSCPRVEIFIKHSKNISDRRETYVAIKTRQPLKKTPISFIKTEGPSSAPSTRKFLWFQRIFTWIRYEKQEQSQTKNNNKRPQTSWMQAMRPLSECCTTRLMFGIVTRHLLWQKQKLLERYYKTVCINNPNKFLLLVSTKRNQKKPKNFSRQLQKSFSCAL